MKAILGKKLMMTRIFDEKGTEIPVTLISFEKNIVSQVKTSEKDGYQAVQIATAEKKKMNKPAVGHLSKIKAKLGRLYEIKTAKELKVGDEINLDWFKEGEIINVTGISKGKGFAGTVKRHNFHLGPKTHGSHNYRQPGSIGSTDAQRVMKGKRMAGHMGAQKTTVKNLKIIKIDLEKKRVLLRGAVPGASKSQILIWGSDEN